MTRVVSVEWRRGFRFQTAAEVAYEAIEALKDDEGNIEPASIVKAARRKRHPLHCEFEWDDTVAANKHREQTARKLLQGIEVVYSEAPEAQPVRQYNVIRKPSKRAPARKVYRSTDDILKDEATRAELLNQAFAELRAFQARFRGLQELAPVFRGIAEALETV